MRTTIKILFSLLAVPAGVFFVVFGERDDSPGAQLIGVVLIAIAVFVFARIFVRSRKKN